MVETDVAGSVEEFALVYYKEKGYDGAHSENNLIPQLFTILYWNIIFDDSIEGVFQSPYQAFPLDLFHSDFYEKRKEKIMKHQEKLGKSELLYVFNQIVDRKTGFANPFIDWESFDPIIAKKAVERIPRNKLLMVIDLFSKDVKKLSKGMPDLFLWNEKEAKFSEVKSKNDKLSDFQKHWLSLLTECQIDCEVLHVL